MEIAKTFQDPRIFFFQRKRPGPGGYAARNLGLEKASGDWVCFLDADDEWTPDYLKNLNKIITRHPTINLIGSGWEVHGNKESKKAEITKLFEDNAFQVLSTEDFLKLSVRNCPALWTSAVAVQKALAQDVGRFPEGKCKAGGDIDTWFRLVWDRGEVGFFNYIAAYYHTDSSNMVTRSLDSFETPCVVHTVVDVLKESPETPLKNLLKLYSNKYLLSQIAKSVLNGQFEPELSDYFYKEVDTKKALILKMFKFKIVRVLYRAYLQKNNPFYGK